MKVTLNAKFCNSEWCDNKVEQAQSLATTNAKLCIKHLIKSINLFEHKIEN